MFFFFKYTIAQVAFNFWNRRKLFDFWARGNFFFEKTVKCKISMQTNRLRALANIYFQF